MSSSTKSIENNLKAMSILEKLALIPKVLNTLVQGVFACFTGLFRSGKRPPEYFKYIMYTMMRNLMRITSTRQQQYITPSTDKSYAIFCKKFAITPTTTVLEDGTEAHWIGPKSAEKIVVNFHGGGYALPGNPEMFELMQNYRQALSKNGVEASFVTLSYDLAPEGRYPRQLQQATALLRHVVEDLHKSPSNIIITGDSAGGNLSIGLISHLSHPHPSINPLKLDGKLAGAVLVSPWVDFDIFKPSMERNAYSDCVHPDSAIIWGGAFLGEPWPHPKTKDNYNQAIMAPQSWWEDIKVEEMLIVAGQQEILIDGIKEWVKTVKSAMGDKCEAIYTVGEAHDQPINDLVLGYKNPGEQARTWVSWVSSKF